MPLCPKRRRFAHFEPTGQDPTDACVASGHRIPAEAGRDCRYRISGSTCSGRSDRSDEFGTPLGRLWPQVRPLGMCAAADLLGEPREPCFGREKSGGDLGEPSWFWSSKPKIVDAPSQLLKCTLFLRSVVPAPDQGAAAERVSPGVDGTTTRVSHCSMYSRCSSVSGNASSGPYGY